MKDTRKIKLHRNSTEFKQLKEIINNKAVAIQRNLIRDKAELERLKTDVETIVKWTVNDWDIEARRKQLNENICAYRYALSILEKLALEIIGAKYEIIDDIRNNPELLED